MHLILFILIGNYRFQSEVHVLSSKKILSIIASKYAFLLSPNTYMRGHETIPEIGKPELSLKG